MGDSFCWDMISIFIYKTAITTTEEGNINKWKQWWNGWNSMKLEWRDGLHFSKIPNTVIHCTNLYRYLFSDLSLYFSVSLMETATLDTSLIKEK